MPKTKPETPPAPQWHQNVGPGHAKVVRGSRSLTVAPGAFVELTPDDVHRMRVRGAVLVRRDPPPPEPEATPEAPVTATTETEATTSES